MFLWSWHEILHFVYFIIIIEPSFRWTTATVSWTKVVAKRLFQKKRSVLGWPPDPTWTDVTMNVYLFVEMRSLMCTGVTPARRMAWLAWLPSAAPEGWPSILNAKLATGKLMLKIATKSKVSENHPYLERQRPKKETQQSP